MRTTQTDSVLIIGSGPNAIDSVDWQGFDRIVAINNAWRIRPDWDDLIFPEDFPSDRRPETLGAHQRLIEADRFVPAQNAYGGFVYGGATMAFTAGYWALYALRPRVMAFIGCDMVYPASGKTHFYGTGAPDPLRADISLLDLTSSAMRLQLMAAAEGCACVNLSRTESTLPFPRSTAEAAHEMTADPLPDPAAYGVALAAEARLGYYVESGRIWEEAGRFDPAQMLHLHTLWRAAHAPLGHRRAAA